MPYLQAVLKEGTGHAPPPSSLFCQSTQDLHSPSVLRLYPSVPVNSRSAVRATTLPRGGGPDGASPIFITKGEAVGYCAYAMHRRKDLYGADADVFRPERWAVTADDNLAKRIGWGYIPFNGGPRLCLGRKSRRAWFSPSLSLPLSLSCSIGRLRC